ncbi:hypothetical protein Tco_0918188, partial [Tanacetum coccineum]
FMIRVVEENGRIHEDLKLKQESKLKLRASLKERHLFTVLVITRSYELRLTRFWRPHEENSISTTLKRPSAEMPQSTAALPKMCDNEALFKKSKPTRDLRRDYGFVATLDDEIRRDLEKDVGYRITDTWDAMVKAMQEDTDEIYGRLDGAQDDRSLMSGQLNLLRRDRRSHARTSRLMETEARISRKAWVQSMDASDITRFEVRALWTMVLAQQTKIGAGLGQADSAGDRHSSQMH